MSEFEVWLAEKLRDLNTDEGVFLPYILSILEGEEESDEEKREGLTGILADCLDTEEAIESALNDIIWNWKSSARSKIADDVTENVQKLDITEKMHAITQEKISNNTIKKIEKSEEEKKLKEAILIGFGDGKADADDDDDGDSGGADLGPANTNSESVQKEAVEMRERQAAAAAAKKEKDKQDRAKQKNQAEERKKKAQEKAAKGERKSGR